MYFPLLTARGVEKNVIVNSIAGQRFKNVIPVITPYIGLGESICNNANYISTVKSLIESEMSFISICKPSEVEELKLDIKNFDSFCIYGLFSNDTYELSDKHSFAIIHDYPAPVVDKQNILFHIFLPKMLASFSYVEQFPHNKRVAIEDAFPAQNRNADYPIESVYSSLFAIYKERFVGFGDYTIQSMDFEPANGSNMTYVSPAIHLTYVRNNTIFVRHYATTPTENPDFSSRVKMTMNKALRDKGTFFYSTGMRDLEAKAATGTSLAKLKEIGVTHHIEFINSLI